MTDPLVLLFTYLTDRIDALHLRFDRLVIWRPKSEEGETWLESGAYGRLKDRIQALEKFREGL